VVLLMASIFAFGQVNDFSPQSQAFGSVVDQPGLPRVLLIGDSISIGYTVTAIRRSRKRNPRPSAAHGAPRVRARRRSRARRLRRPRTRPRANRPGNRRMRRHRVMGVRLPR